jgi:hypothetical protein
MSEDKPLPLTRMVTINKPSFWIFIVACMVLYVSNKALTPDTLEDPFVNTNDLIIMGVAFGGLLLNVIGLYINDTQLNRIFTTSCYVLEAIGIIVLGILVFAP